MESREHVTQREVSSSFQPLGATPKPADARGTGASSVGDATGTSVEQDLESVAADCEAIVRRAADLFNARDFDGLADLYADDVEFELVAFGSALQGRHTVKELMMSRAAALQDARVTIDRVTASPGGAVVEFTARGTHTGPLLTPGGTLPATGEYREIRICRAHDIERGKIRRAREYTDTAPARNTDAASAETERLIRRSFDAFNARDFETLASMQSPDVETLIVPTHQLLRGLDATLEDTKNWTTAFLDGRADLTRVIATPTHAVVEFWGRGTQTGPFVTPAGTLPPTGRRVEFQLCFVYDIANGKIRRVHQYYDVANIMAQLRG